MSNLSERIRKGIEQKQAEEKARDNQYLAEERQKRAREAAQTRDTEIQKDRMLKEARGYFYQYLMPIFEEVAGMKGISTNEDPYEGRGFLGKKYKSEAPQRNGLAMSENLAGLSNGVVKVEGDLIWDVRPDNRSGAYYDVVYRHLNLSVSNDGQLSVGYTEFNMSDHSGLNNFQEKVVEVMVNNGMDGGWKPYVEPPSYGDAP